MSFSRQLQQVTDKLSYNLAYAPDYPVEDRTDLDREESLINEWLSKLITTVRREDVGDWLRLGSMSIDNAFAKFRANKCSEACKEIEAAQQYFRNAKQKKRHRADFIGTSNGVIIPIYENSSTRSDEINM